MTPDVQYGQFSIINVVIGLACGWMVMGRLTGKGYKAAIGSGLRTSVTVTVWALLIFSIVLMVRKAFKKRYDSPMEAITDIFTLALEQGQLVFTLEVLSALVIGGVLGGIAAEWAKRRWD